MGTKEAFKQKVEAELELAQAKYINRKKSPHSRIVPQLSRGTKSAVFGSEDLTLNDGSIKP